MAAASAPELPGTEEPRDTAPRYLKPNVDMQQLCPLEKDGNPAPRDVSVGEHGVGPNRLSTAGEGGNSGNPQ